MSLIQLVKRNGPSGFGYSSTADSVTEHVRLEGKTILVTGINSGLGHETMRVLASRGAHVIGAARTQDRANEAAATVSGQATGLACELSDPQSVSACVASIAGMGITLDAIICNAGIMALPNLKLVNGYECQFYTNHVGHFQLVTGLLDHLADSGRVVIVSSAAHRMAPKTGVDFDNLDGHAGYRAWSAYGQSKFANLLFAKELARRFDGTGKTANAVHPGVIKTNLGRGLGKATQRSMGLFAAVANKSVPQGAATQVFVATHPSLVAASGKYFADCNIAKARADADDTALAARLWDVSEMIVAKLTDQG